jgi:hypothetical protein
MTQSIQVPTTATDKYNVVLGGTTYNITFRFNTREARWYFDLYQEDNTPIKLGVKVMENQSLLFRYRLDNFSGDIICIEVGNSESKYVGRDNLGIDKEYQLVYYTEEELGDS